MTEIEDLLRRALAETPVAPATVDPLGTLDRRVRRARRRVAVVAAAATAAVVAAVVVPLATLGGGSSAGGRADLLNSPPASTSPSPTPPPGGAVVWQHEAYAVTSAGGGPLWVTTRNVNSGEEQWNLIEQNPTTGRMLQGTQVTGPADHVVAGGGGIWAFGGGDGAYSDGSVSALDPVSGRLASHTWTGSGPYALAVDGATAWVTLPSGQRVERLDASGTGTALPVTGSVHLSSQVTDVASTGDGSIWVLQDLDHRITQVSTGASPHVVASYGWGGRLLGPAGKGELWASDSAGRLVLLTPANLAAGESVALGVRIDVPGKPLAVAEDGSGGLFVAVYGSGAGANGVAYYADARTADANARPTAFLPVKNVRTVAADGHGGVVFTADQTEYHWTPTG